ncbi:hypothetical protein [Undibacterium sp.]|uniref:hypothetical protein n=1 Tax=Undibacterium sp. TaxID=1914977 RepID=UPI00374DCFAC
MDEPFLPWVNNDMDDSVGRHSNAYWHGWEVDGKYAHMNCFHDIDFTRLPANKKFHVVVFLRLIFVSPWINEFTFRQSHCRMGCPFM